MVVAYRMSVLGLLVAGAGCVEVPDPPPTLKPIPTETTTTTTPTGTATDTTTGTTDTGTAYDCSTPLSDGPFTLIPYDVQTEEDFDFDGDGYVVYQEGSTLVGRTQSGDQRIYAAGVSGDPAGVQVLYSGDIAVAAQDSGTIERVNPQTGNTTTMISGLIQANGIEVGAGDRLYFTEFTTNGSVRWYDPALGTGAFINGNLSVPHGLALSPDEQVLYVGGPSIMAFDRIDVDEWDSVPRILYDGNDDFDGVEVDICGNIYTIEFTTGHLFRVAPDGSEATLLAVLDDPQAGWNAWNSLRWGNDAGGWDSTVLYITNRSNLWAIDLGVPGRPHPSMGP